MLSKIAGLLCFLLLFIVSCTPVDVSPTEPTDTYSISGKIVFTSLNSDLGLVDVKVEVLGDNDKWEVITSEDGAYTLQGLPAGTYTVVPSRKNWAFTPPSYAVVINNSSINNRDFLGSAATGYFLDPWGYIWEKNKSSASTWLLAKEDCESRGGRLPTPTEIYRNSGAVGSDLFTLENGSVDPTYIISIIAYNQTNSVTVRATDGDTSYLANSSTCTYRCVWPYQNEDSFRGAYIYTAPGEEGFQLEYNGKKFYMDTFDRPKLTYNAALREAAFYHAFIPTESLYTAAIQAGLPNGNGLPDGWLYSSDHEGWSGAGFLVGCVKWEGIDTLFDDTYSTYSNNIYIADSNSYRYRFRLAGVSEPVVPHPVTIENEWVDPQTKLKTTQFNEDPAAMVNAIDLSFERGGHLPTHQELTMLIQAGLPNGMGTASLDLLWTSDYADGSRVIIECWTGTQPEFTGYHSTFMTHSEHYASTLHSYRTVYYPIDPDFNGPSESLCQGGRFEVVKGPVKIWTDMYDRTPQTFGEAVRICHQLGGHLATRRDMVELIRNDLPNGYDHWVWTADQDWYNQVDVVKWTNVESDFQDQYGSTADAYVIVNNGTVAQPFRCVWTNELRIP